MTYEEYVNKRNNQEMTDEDIAEHQHFEDMYQAFIDECETFSIEYEAKYSYTMLAPVGKQNQDENDIEDK